MHLYLLRLNIYIYVNDYDDDVSNHLKQTIIEIYFYLKIENEF